MVPVCAAAQLALNPARVRSAGLPVAMLSCPTEHPSPGGSICRKHSQMRSMVKSTDNCPALGGGGLPVGWVCCRVRKEWIQKTQQPLSINKVGVASVSVRRRAE